jgi:hemerythrin
MCADPAKSAPIEAVEEDHRQLKATLNEINKSIGERSVPVERAKELLDGLCDRLENHFELEEKGGYFTEAIEHAPQLSGKADDLVDEHAELSECARKILESAPTEEGSDAWWQHIDEQFNKLRKELLTHERDEDRLIQEAYHRDLGAND